MSLRSALHVFFLVTALLSATVSAGAQEYVPGEVLVVFQPGTARVAVDQVLAKHGIHVIEYFEHVDVYHVTVAAGKTVAQTTQLLAAEGVVRGADPNYVVKPASHLTTPNDPEFPRQWGLNNTGNNLVGAAGLTHPLVAQGVIDADIDAPQAWQHGTDCSGEVVAVIDTGVDFGHPDFAGNIYANPGEIAGDGLDNDGNGIIDDVNGANFATHEMHDETVVANTFFDAGETIYVDVDSSGTVTVGDLRRDPIAGPPALAVGPVVAGDGDIGRVLVRFTPFPVPAPPGPPNPADPQTFWRHAENVAANGLYDAGESIYADPDNSMTVSAGDALVQGPAQPAATALVNFRRILNGGTADVQGHGTSVAGVIGARGNNMLNIAGVCWNVQLMSLRVYDGQSNSSVADTIAAVNYTVGLKTRPVAPVNVRVLNYSSEHAGAVAAESAAIGAAGAAGIVFVTISGNGVQNGGVGFNMDAAAGPLIYPCAYVPAGVDNIICVGASTNRDNRASFSNWGTVSVDLNAPGQDIRTLRRTADGGGTRFIDGTSFAAPHVAGIAAHFWSRPGFGGHTVAQLKARILSGLNGPVGVPHPHGVDPRPGLAGTVVSGITNDGRARMIMGDDFGDAQDPPYPTLLANWGARHEDIGEEWLGRAPDPLPSPPCPPDAGDVSPEFDAVNAATYPPDPDGMPNLVDNDAHDDGIDLFPPYVFSPPGGPPNTGTVRVHVRTENNNQIDFDAGRYGGVHPAGQGVHGGADNKFVWVNGFFDWNKDGDWNDATEHVFMLRVDPSTWVDGAGVRHNGGCYDIVFNMPPPPPGFGPYDIWSRFRLDYGENLGQALAPPPAAVGPSPGGLVKFWDSPGGLPFAKGANVANLYESITPLGAPPALDLKRGLAQFGEVEDYITQAKKPATPVEPGCDGFFTPGGCNSFTNHVIPANFFAPGSLAYSNAICLRGVPFESDPFNPLHYIDTIVERLAPADFPQCGPPGLIEVPIVIRALNMVNESPIVVHYGNGSTETWNLRVCLRSSPPAAQPVGTMSIIPLCQEGGQWSATLPVRPKLTFTRVSDGLQRIMENDPAGQPIELSFTSTCNEGPCHWSYDPGPDHNVMTISAGTTVDGNCDGVAETLAVGSSNFIPGLRPTPCEDMEDPCKNGSMQKDKELTEEEAMLDAHGVLPPQTPPTCQTCPGDTNSDNLRNVGDIVSFVECLLEGLVDIEKCPCADMNGDGLVDGRDVALFAATLLNPPPWPPPEDPNNNCLNPTSIAGPGTFSYNNHFATTDGPSTPCGQISQDLWYAWTAPATCQGVVRVETCGTSLFNTAIAVYDGCGGWGTPSQPPLLTCNDDFCGGQSRVQFTAVAGNCYTIRIGSHTNTASGQGAFVITCLGPPPCLTNDLCNCAQTIFTAVPVSGTTVGMTNDYAGTCGASAASPDVWYSWTSDCPGSATVSLCGGGTTYDSVVEVLSACGGPTIACNDDFCGLQSQISFPVTPATTYLVRVSGFNNLTGNFSLVVNCGGGATGACCNGITCSVTTQSGCQAGGGTYLGDGTTCSPNPCGAPACNVNPSQCQIPDQLGHGAAGTLAATSDRNENAGNGFWVTEDVTAAAPGLITQACWWGIYRDFAASTDCSAGAVDDFQIVYYNANGPGGRPGSIKAGPFLQSGGTLLGVSRIPTGNTILIHPEFIFHAQHAPVNVAGNECVWVEITNTANSVPGCSWLWETAPPGDQASFQDADANPGPQYATLVANDYDMALCVNANLVPGAGCLTGACCVGSFCQATNTQAACTALGGTWFSGQTCPGFPCGAAPNDNCANATPVGIPSITSGSTVSATAETPAPPTCVTTITAPGVWYSLIGNGHTLTVTTCDGNAGAGYDTKLNVYTGTCGNWTCVTGNDDGATPDCAIPGGNLFESRVTFCATAGTQYLILVQGFNGAVGPFTLAVQDGASCGGIAPPGSDNCSSAPPLNPGTTASGTTVGATLDGSATCGNATGPDVWWIVNAPPSSSVTINACGSGYDTVLSAHSGCPGTTSNELACNDDSACGLQSTITFTMPASGLARIRLSGFNGASGAYNVTRP